MLKPPPSTIKHFAILSDEFTSLSFCICLPIVVPTSHTHCLVSCVQEAHLLAVLAALVRVVHNNTPTGPLRVPQPTLPHTLWVHRPVSSLLHRVLLSVLLSGCVVVYNARAHCTAHMPVP